MRRSKIAASGTLAALLLLVPACGSSSHRSTATTSPTTAPAPSHTSTTPPAATAVVPAQIGPVAITVSGALGSEPHIGGGSTHYPNHVVYRDLITGSGPVVTAESTTKVAFVAANYGNAKVFDASWTDGTNPATFVVDRLVPGLALGMLGMHAGGRRLVVIPPSYAYGASGNGPIQPYETLVFVIDLLSVALNPNNTAVPGSIGGSVAGPIGSEPTVKVPTVPAPSQITYRDLVVGTGPQAQPTSTVDVQFVGLDYANGETFDSTWTSSGATQVVLNKAVVGFQAGVAGMRVGGRREIVVPAEEGYGAKGAGAVGPNEALIFVVDLLGVQ